MCFCAVYLQVTTCFWLAMEFGVNSLADHSLLKVARQGAASNGDWCNLFGAHFLSQNCEQGAAFVVSD